LAKNNILSGNLSPCLFYKFYNQLNLAHNSGEECKFKLEYFSAFVNKGNGKFKEKGNQMHYMKTKMFSRINRPVQVVTFYNIVFNKMCFSSGV